MGVPRTYTSCQKYVPIKDYDTGVPIFFNAKQ